VSVCFTDQKEKQTDDKITPHPASSAGYVIKGEIYVATDVNFHLPRHQ